MPGEGSIFKLRDGRWRAQVSIGPRTNRRFVTRTVPTRAEAQLALVELQDARRAGVATSRTTLGDYLERWVDSARNIRPSTRTTYRAVVTYHLQPTIGSVRLAALTPSHVEEMLARLEPRMSAKSLRNVHAVLRRALGQAVRARLIPVNVASREYVDAPRVTVDEPDAFTVDETRRLLEAAAGDRYEALFVTALGTGLRQGELLGLAWQDLDLGATLPAGASGLEPAWKPRSAGARDEVGRLTDDSPLRPHLRVRYELVRRDGRYYREEPKTDRSRRTVPLSPAVVAALHAHRQRTIDEGFVPTATGPVFTNRSGGPLNGSWLTHHHYALLERAGVRRLPFKNLRTTFASRLFEAGVSDLEIAQLMGHTRTHTTKRHYIALGDRHASALEAIEEMVG